MRNKLLTSIILTCSVFLASCDKDKDQKIEQLLQAKDHEVEARHNCEKDVEIAKGDMKKAYGIGASVFVIAFLAGIAVGSKSRKDSLLKSDDHGENA